MEDDKPYMKALANNKQPTHYTLEQVQRHPSYVPTGTDIKLTIAEATVALDSYLLNLHTQLWPRGQWTITNVGRREDAIDWFIDVCKKLGLVRNVFVQEPVREQIVPLRVVEDTE